MAERDSQRVGGVVRLGNLLQLKKPFDHLHDLLLVRFAVACDGLLDLQRRILIHRYPVFMRREQQNAPAVRNGNTRLQICVENSSSTATASGLNCFISELTSS